MIQDFEELDINQFTDNGLERQKEMQHLKNSIDRSRYALSEIERKKANLMDELSNEDDADLRTAIKSKFRDLKTEQEGLESLIREQENALEKYKGNGREMKKSIEQLKEVYPLLDITSKDKEAIEARIRFRNEVQRICEYIKIYPAIKKSEIVDDHGIEFWSKSKGISKIVIKFKGSAKLRILQLQGYREV